MRIPVVELLRVSSETQAQEDRAGLASQHTANLRTCDTYGLEIIETVELVISGTDVADTPEMQRVRDLVESGRARGIVIAEYSRLSRSDRFSDQRVLQTFADHGAPIYLPSGPLDLQSESGFVSASVYQLVASLERRRINERMMRGKEEHRKRGEHVAGGVGIPFGLAYDRDSGWTYTPDIERVRELFRRFLGGDRNYQGLGDDLGMARSTVRFVLGNPVYTGWRIYDQRRDLTVTGKRPGTRDRRKIARAPEDVLRVRLPLEPVISESDHAIVLAAMTEIERRVVRTEHADAFAYRGHLVCDCGRSMYCAVNRFGGEVMKFNYGCPTRFKGRAHGAPSCPTGFMRREKLEPLLDAQVAANLCDPDLLLELLAAHQDAAVQPAADVSAQVRELERKRGRIIELAIDGAIDRTERAQRLAGVDRQLRALKAVGARHASTAPAPDTIQTVQRLVTVFVGWQRQERADKLAILDALHAQLHIGKYAVRGITLPVASLANSPVPTADRVGIGAIRSRPTIFLPFAGAA